MFFWGNLCVAGFTLEHPSMVELVGGPVVDDVTVGAFTGEMIGIAFVGGQNLVTAAAFGGCVGVLAIAVARLAVYLCVPAG